MKDQAQTDFLIPISESRRLLGGIGRTKFYELVNSGDLHLHKLGRKSVISNSEVQRLVARIKSGELA